jgi:hypothetical protein
VVFVPQGRFVVEEPEIGELRRRPRGGRSELCRARVCDVAPGGVLVQGGCLIQQSCDEVADVERGEQSRGFRVGAVHADDGLAGVLVVVLAQVPGRVVGGVEKLAEERVMRLDPAGGRRVGQAVEF